MIRNLLATTALATLVATAAYAQDATQPQTEATPSQTEPMQPQTNDAMQPKTNDAMQPDQAAAPAVQAEGYLASNIMGETVYNGTGENAENIGDVNDIVLDKDGNAHALVIGVGGFLGVGERSVAVEFAKLSWAEGNGDRWLVYPSTKEELEALPEFDRRPFDPAPAPTAANDTGAAPATTDTTAQAPATETPAATDQPATATDTTTTAAIDKSQLTDVPADQLSADNLIGTTVYGANDENIGEVNDVVLNQDGKTDAVIIDVGGFLGMGEKQVALDFSQLSFMADKDGNKYLYTSFTKEQLDAQTAYDKGTYAQKRDEQLMKLQ